MTGVYVAVKLTELTNKNLRQFVDDVLQLPPGSRIKEKEYHITVAYSKEGFNYTKPEVELLHGCEVFPKHYSIFGEDEKVLVLEIQSEDLQKRFDECVAGGYIPKFTPYKPHITIGVTDDPKYTEKSLPDFKLIIDHEFSEPLDDDFVYKPKEMSENKMSSFDTFLVEMAEAPPSLEDFMKSSARNRWVQHTTPDGTTYNVYARKSHHIVDGAMKSTVDIANVSLESFGPSFTGSETGGRNFARALAGHVHHIMGTAENLAKQHGFDGVYAENMVNKHLIGHSKAGKPYPLTKRGYVKLNDPFGPPSAYKSVADEEEK